MTKEDVRAVTALTAIRSRAESRANGKVRARMLSHTSDLTYTPIDASASDSRNPPLSLERWRT